MILSGIAYSNFIHVVFKNKLNNKISKHGYPVHSTSDKAFMSMGAWGSPQLAISIPSKSLSFHVDGKLILKFFEVF